MLLIFIALQLNPMNYLHFCVVELCVLPSLLNPFWIWFCFHASFTCIFPVFYGDTEEPNECLAQAGSSGWEMGLDWNIPVCSGSRVKGEFCFGGDFWEVLLCWRQILPFCSKAELTWQDLLSGEHKCSNLVFAASFNSFPIQYQSPSHLLWIGRLKCWCFPALVWEVISSEWH